MARFPFDVVAFDLDGTLADTAPDLTAALNHALGLLGHRSVPAAEVRHMVGHGARALLRRGLAFQGVDDEEEVARGLPLFLAYYRDHIADGSHPFPGVEAALDVLAGRGVALAVCTNKAEALARRFLDAIGWAERFAAVIGGDTVGVGKPDPAPLRAAVAAAGGGRAAMVGDSISDTGAARAAGLPCVALTFGFSDRPPTDLGADLLIDHFDALIPALERLGGAMIAAGAATAELLEAFDEPLLLLDGAIVAEANAAARALLGEKIAGRYVLSVVPLPEAAHLLTTGGAGSIPLSGLDPSDRRWELSVTPAGVAGRLVRFEDRSIQHAAERMRTDFVANASHELRTPLAALIGYVETLSYANAPEDEPDRARFLAIMGQEAQRMQRLIDDLMSLSRIEADRYVAPRDRVDFEGVVRTTCHEAKERARLELTIAAPAGAIINGDRGLLLQMADNIVSNALRYARPASLVRIGLATDETAVRLVIADEGEGIAPEHLPRLTERFYRVAASRSRALGGTGLGLAIVKHIVERHRGRLEIASEQGVGTTVTVTLPLTPQP